MSNNPAIAGALARMDKPLAVDVLIDRAKLIQDAIARRMVEGIHYGQIPGTQRKSLRKAGAEALADLFQFRSVIVNTVVEYPDDHREVRATCTLYVGDESQPALVQRSGLCTTKETKYRWRNENTGAEPPPEYWKKGTPDYKNSEVLGGPDFYTRKVDGHWLVFHQIPVANVADSYHTVAAMAEKRAFVAAVIAACAASDALVSEDDPVYGERREKPKPRQEPPRQATQATQAEQKTTTPADDRRPVVTAMLESKACVSTAALMEAWGQLTEADRKLMGGDFGRIKKLAEQTDQQATDNGDGFTN